MAEQRWIDVPVVDGVATLPDGRTVASSARVVRVPAAPLPRRIERQRTKGWRMPDGAVYVGRPGPWGNPFRVTRAKAELADVMVPATDLMARLVAVLAFRSWITKEITEHLTVDLSPLRGHDLACWCSLDEPCHADVLLELANG